MVGLPDHVTLSLSLSLFTKWVTTGVATAHLYLPITVDYKENYDAS